MQKPKQKQTKKKSSYKQSEDTNTEFFYYNTFTDEREAIESLGMSSLNAKSKGSYQEEYWDSFKF